MGRFFSTVYRFILVVASVSALVFSILSATSCAFVKFDHQYKGDTRHLLANSDLDDAAAGGDVGATRALLEANATEVDDTAAPGLMDGVADALVNEGVAETETEGDAAAEVAAGATDPTTVEAAAVEGAATETTVAAATEGAAAEATDPPAVEPAAVEGTTAEVTGSASAEPAATEGAATEATDPPAVEPAAVEGTTAEVTGSASVEPATTAATVAATAEESAPAVVPAPDDDDDTDDYNGIWKGNGSGGGSDSTDDYNGIWTGNNDGQVIPTPEVEPSPASSEAAATASGDAGLYCDGIHSFSATNFFKQSATELRDEFAELSDQDQSEEVARGAAVMAVILGSIPLLVLAVEMIFSWKMCCDRWIVGIVSACACVSQGITFLFFNSERYCDGDIINEILNQEPCVMGQGGIYSVVALVLYALVMIMACRLPQDDPYGIFCRKRSAARNAEKAEGGASGSGRTFGLLGSSGKSSGIPDEADDDAPGATPQDRERPNWLSEENKEQEDEENKII